MLRAIHQRLSIRYAVCSRSELLLCGYDDLNDHDRLRQDLLLQTAVGRAEALASSQTLCRLETDAARADAFGLHEVLIEQFIASHPKAPKRKPSPISSVPQVPRQFRLLLASLAYTLMQRLRELALQGSELANACAATCGRVTCGLTTTKGEPTRCKPHIAPRARGRAPGRSGRAFGRNAAIMANAPNPRANAPWTPCRRSPEQQ